MPTTTTLTWNGVAWVDDKGNRASEADLMKIGAGAVVQEGKRELTRVIPRILTPGAAMTGGALGGEALGAMAAPETGGLSLALPLFGAAMGAGTANVAANKLLPEQLGGNPKESVRAGFLWGALPELGLGGAGKLLEGKILKRGAEATHADYINQLEKPESGAVRAGDLASTLNRPSLAPAPPAVGNRLTDRTFATRDAVLGPINRMRRAYGDPIGRAYDSLKGKTDAISPQEAGDIAAAAQNVNDKLIAPAPRAASVFAKLKSFEPPPPEPALSDEEKVRAALKSGTQLEDINLAQSPEAPKYKPPTLDELRELRQRVNIALRTATGGDVNALLNLQQAIDEHLMPHLPPDMAANRRAYAGFVQRFKWQDINRLRGLGTPSEVSQWAFGGTPERAHEIVAASRGAERATLQNAFTDRMLRNVDPRMPPEAQVAAVEKNLQPYLANGTAARLYGPATDRELARIRYAPILRERAASILKQPEQKQAFIDEWKRIGRYASKNDKAAADAGAQKMLDSLSPQDRQLLLNPPVEGAQLPVAMGRQEAMTQGMMPAARDTRGEGQGLRFRVPFALSRIAMGSPGYAGAMAAAYASMAATRSGYRSLMEAGAARPLANFVSAINGRGGAHKFFQMMVALGSATGQEQTQ